MSIQYFIYYLLVIVLNLVFEIYLGSASNHSYIGGPRPKTKTRLGVLVPMDPSEHPYAVLVLCMTTRNIHLASGCSGSILTRKWVLTAGHCIKKYNRYTGQITRRTQFVLYAGGNKYGDLTQDRMPPGSQAPWANLAINHPMARPRHYDIGIIRVAGPGFTFNRVVNFIKMAMRPFSDGNYYKCNVTGFGKVEMFKDHGWDGKRKTQELEVINKTRDWPCKDVLYTDFSYSHPRKWVICSKPTDYYGLCIGDSGAGLVCNGELVGVASFFLPYNYETCTAMDSEIECATRNSMNCFFDTCQFISWIIPQVDPRPDIYTTLHRQHACWNRELAYGE